MSWGAIAAACIAATVSAVLLVGVVKLSVWIGRKLGFDKRAEKRAQRQHDDAVQKEKELEDYVRRQQSGNR